MEARADSTAEPQGRSGCLEGMDLGRVAESPERALVVTPMTLALAAELAPTITVNAVAPAMIDPPPDLTAAEIESIRHASPLQRIGRPEDATRLVLYLLEGSDFVTGAIYRVDGGRFLGVDGKD